jgi:endonuclease YncB( thermonuclease family)
MKRAWLAVALAGWVAAAQAYTGMVSRVADGDTLWVQPDGKRGKPVKVRLLGIDAPELCQSGGRQARAALASRVLHRSVRVETRAVDDYRRTLADVRVNGEDVSAWMVSQGHAWSNRYRYSPGPYAEQEQQARAAGRGIFAQRDAQEPRAFRKVHGPCK